MQGFRDKAVKPWTFRWSHPADLKLDNPGKRRRLKRRPIVIVIRHMTQSPSVCALGLSSPRMLNLSRVANPLAQDFAPSTLHDARLERLGQCFRRPDPLTTLRDLSARNGPGTEHLGAVDVNITGSPRAIWPGRDSRTRSQSSSRGCCCFVDMRDAHASCNASARQRARAHKQEPPSKQRSRPRIAAPCTSVSRPVPVAGSSRRGTWGNARFTQHTQRRAAVRFARCLLKRGKERPPS